MRYSEAIQRFNEWNGIQSAEMTVTVYDSALRQFGLYMQDGEIEDTTIDDVIRWFMLMKNLKWAQNAFLPKSAALRKFFGFYRMRGVNVLDPTLIPVARKEHKVTTTVDEATYAKVEQAMLSDDDPTSRSRNMTILGMFWDTGIRVGELCNMSVENIDKDIRSALIRTEKAKHKRPFRQIYWSDKTRDHLREWLTVRPGNKQGALFVSLDKRAVGHPITTRSVQRLIKVTANQLKLTGVTCHTFRHSKAHRIIQSGGSSADVMNILGHSNVSSTSRYLEMGGEELKNRAISLM